MVAVLNSSLARSSRVALAALVVGHAGVLRQQQRRIAPRRAQCRDVAELRPRRRRIHQAAARQSRTTARRGRASSAPSCAPRRITSARRAASPPTGKLEEALVEYQLAAELNPGNADIERELQDTRAQLRAKVAVREDGKTRLESLIAQSLAAPLPGADLPADAKLPDSVVFRDASARDVYSAIGKFTNLSVMFDPTFRDQPVSIDLRGQSLERGAERAVADDAQFLARHRAAHHHRRARHGGQAPRVRRRDRPHVLPEQRRPQGNDRHAPHRRRCAPHLRRSPRPTPSPSRTRPSASPPPARSSRRSTRRGRK